ncbi:hypothetical protein DPMN_099758 [Dreissena polymorpha]|uniref:Uncharacterized protein n=1 Tax=Dreissena polymorpha TaxID=45954 RepID=A0A9D4R7J0_DREPO|nr:hypothetical protein DPMN_099758 [Dreissena polymorpha]
MIFRHQNFFFGDNLEEQVDDVDTEEKRSNKLSGHKNTITTTTNRSFLGQWRPQGPHGYKNINAIRSRTTEMCQQSHTGNTCQKGK